MDYTCVDNTHHTHNGIPVPIFDAISVVAGSARMLHSLGDYSELQPHPQTHLWPSRWGVHEAWPSRKAVFESWPSHTLLLTPLTHLSSSLALVVSVW